MKLFASQINTIRYSREKSKNIIYLLHRCS